MDDKLHHKSREANPIAQLFWEEDNEHLSKQNLEITTWKVVVNIMNSMEGSGFLALPYAVYEGGISILIGLVVLAVVMAYTAYLLADCLDEEDEFGDRRRVRWSYQDIGMAFWPPFEHIVRIFVSIGLFTNAAGFIVLCSSMMSQQFPHVPITKTQ